MKDALTIAVFGISRQQGQSVLRRTEFVQVLSNLLLLLPKVFLRVPSTQLVRCFSAFSSCRMVREWRESKC